MLSNENLVTVAGNLTSDPVNHKDKVVTMRLAISWAGQEKDSDNNAGFFDVKYFLNDSKNSSFLRSQIDAGNIAKGKRIGVIGQLRQERFAREDGSNGEKVVIVAESIFYTGGGVDRSSADKSAENGSESPERIEALSADF